jgi:hypothetical protein
MVHPRHFRPETPRYVSKDHVPDHDDIKDEKDTEVVYEGNRDELLDLPNRTSKVYISQKGDTATDDTGIYEEYKPIPEHEKQYPKTLFASLAIIIGECILITIYSVFFIPHMQQNELVDSQQVVHVLVLYVCDLIGSFFGFLTAVLGIMGSWYGYHWSKQIIFTHLFICGLCVNIILCIVSGILGIVVLADLTFGFIAIMVIYLILYGACIYFGSERVKTIRMYMVESTTKKTLGS